ncbi:MAG TPA: aspartate aminotransferase family protein [Amaricoccus sp.]|uniref:aspartate aminotransferase family protein n=1 Tax=Amaricoccus sp. TaxID=1872485 RepID=UPI002B78A5FA|nr:aspartate aminotransferase family protein [Amaricoccus sp.]HMQ92184.1 aspartate aminotransferase family protein [Amaricoccus sp.]HMR52605.1 aspartate aminotransferase family protein [Amaricoccus sp.]HMR59601.1 aspartate aminotransferase family protein [Amaricoccus sp.]HMT99623.1 aspartate aminotransferase family protein [Amaricoccus sp.]
MITPVLPTYARAPLAFVEGQGAWLIEEGGERYLDFGAGIAVAVLGHAHPALVEALETQGRRLWHTSNLYRIPNQERLAEKLVARTFADTVFVTNSGAEAVECAIKMARKHFSAKGQPERHRIVTFEGAFHGRTMAAISAAGGEKLVKGFDPLLPGFDILPFGDIEAVRAAVGPQTAAIMAEPILGEGGIRQLPDAALRDLRAIADAEGILLILDEIQTGMGRTGRLFAHEWAGITPDIMPIAKGIGGGFPLGACLATEHAASGMTLGTHGSTYGGNPLACAIGCAVLDIVATPEFLAGVSRTAGRLRQGLEGLVAAHPKLFSEVRGQGLMLGIGCLVPNGEVVAAGYDAKILTVVAAGNVVRILPPLNLSDAEVDEGLRRLDAAASALEARQ